MNVFNDDSKSKRKASSKDQENADPETAPEETPAAAEKSEAEIQQEIQSLFRQVTASVTFLPMLDGNCTFNVLVYADADSDVPLEWGDSDAKEVKNAEKVQLRSFSTNSHKIDTLVSYRYAGQPFACVVFVHYFLYKLLTAFTDSENEISCNEALSYV